MNWMIYTGIGALGGIVTTLEWLDKRYKEEKAKNKDIKLIEILKKINPFKVTRNLVLGAIVGGFFGTSSNDMIVAFMTGTAGEFYIQNLGKTVERRVSK